jgi:hypothetical protein
VLALALLGLLPRAASCDQALKIEGRLRFERARITLDGGQRHLGTTVTLWGDSLSFTERLLGSVGYEPLPESLGLHHSISLEEVNRIEVVGGSRAAMGAGIGALIGFGLWALVASAANESLGETVFWGVVVFVIPGAGIGALAGSAADDWDTVYERDRGKHTWRRPDSPCEGLVQR